MQRPLRQSKDGPSVATTTAPPATLSAPRRPTSSGTSAKPNISSPSTSKPAAGIFPAASSPPAAGTGHSRKPSSGQQQQQQSQRDRLIAVFAQYEPQKVQHVDALLKRLNDHTKAETFIVDYAKKHGGEPASKEEAMRSFFLKQHNGNKVEAEKALELIKSVPGMEPDVFAQILQDKKPAAAAAGADAAKAGAPSSPTGKKAVAAPAAGATAAAGGKQAMRPASPSPGGKKTAAGGGMGNAATSGSSSSLAALDNSSSSPRKVSFDDSPVQRSSTTVPPSPNQSGGAAVEASPPRPKSTCDRAVRDRVVAMLATYDPDSLLQFDEDCDIAETAVGSAFLNSLIEQHGPEPSSKRSALEVLLQRLFEKQDPQRMRSVKTLVSAGESSPGKDLQIVRAMFQAYGLGHKVGKSVASLGLAPPPSTISSDIARGAGASGSSSSSSNNNSKHTTTSIMAPFSPAIFRGASGAAGGLMGSAATNAALGGSTGWSPDGSLASQQGLFSSAPRRLPLNTKADLESQLSTAPKVRKLTTLDPAPDFNDLLVHDTFVGEQDMSGAGGVGGKAATSDVIEKALAGHNPFEKAARGEVSKVHDSDDSDGLDDDNPFLKPGQSPAYAKGQVPKNKVALEPKAPEMAMPTGFGF